MTDNLLDHLRRALGDAYTIERELSGGGMSRVFVARERALGREVVIKVLPKELALGVNRERFRQEVQLAARLSHPYIVTLLHAGEHEDLLWFTMPFITGESLKIRLEKSGPLPVREMVQYSRDVLEALSYAHAQGVIHRDIKPANILIDGGHALVTDFGVAKALSAAMPSVGAGHTTTGMAIGTPAYMAPEQLAADPAADHRVDIYAMGLLMYELLAGVSPFATPSPTATMAAQLTRMPDSLDKVRNDVPSALSALIRHCLAKNPEERPASAEAVLKALDQISGELAVEAHRSNGSRLVRRLVPITAVLAFVAVAATAAVVYAKRNAEPAPVVVTPKAPVVSTDDPAVVAISPGELEPRTGEDSARRKLALLEELERLDPSYSRERMSAPDISKLDSLVNAAVDARLKASQAAIPRPPQAPNTARGGFPSATIERQGGAREAPRKVVVETGAFTRGMPDTALRELSDQIGRELTQRMGGSWVVVRREQDAGRPDPAKDTAVAGADALVSITLSSPRRSSPDSVYLRMIVTNAGGGGSQVLTSGQVFKPTSPTAFQQTIDNARGLLFSIQGAPRGMPWMNRFAPDTLQRIVGGRGNRRGGPEGGPYWMGDSGRRGGQGGGRDSASINRP